MSPKTYFYNIYFLHVLVLQYLITSSFDKDFVKPFSKGRRER